jgi:hypothetical protein
MKQQISHYLTMLVGDISELQYSEPQGTGNNGTNALVDAASVMFGPDAFEKGIGTIMTFFQEVQSQAVVNQQQYRDRSNAAIQAPADTDSDSSDSEGEETKKSD